MHSTMKVRATYGRLFHGHLRTIHSNTVYYISLLSQVIVQYGVAVAHLRPDSQQCPEDKPLDVS